VEAEIPDLPPSHTINR